MGPSLLRERSSELLRETRSPLTGMKKDAAFVFTKGRKFLDAVLGSAFGATSQALHAACHKDLLDL